MNPTPHEETLFQAALPLAGVERAAFLDRECAGDPALRARLEALLAAHEQPDTLFGTQAEGVRPTISLDFPRDLADDLVGQTIGRYKLLGRIGEGGCGVVYVAEQTEPVRRRVALKIIKLGMDTKQVVARFEAERQALAMMDHPNIAKVLDAGTTDGGKPEIRSPRSETNPRSGGSSKSEVALDPLAPSGASEAARAAASPLPTDGRGVGGEGLPPSPSPSRDRSWSPSRIPTGRPYFVMELVRGIKITDYCDQEHLSARDRLDLFIKVCHAIQHAHQKGIIHRDIKPSNILVTLHDGVPVPKVIDFGIAKAVEGRLTDATVYTQLHQFIGTPAYMSPEQAEMSGLDIDTRSDIYSLGVLLYELLTGVTPFDARELMSQGIDAMRRTIREQEPVRPSTRLTQLRQQEQSQAPIANSRGRAAQARAKSEIRNQKSDIETDLDWIVMKCLEKDRGRRYETANGLAADLKRHLSSEPVTARPPSAVYRFQKAFRRNKLAFGAAVAVVGGLLVAVVSLAVAIEQSRDALEAARELAVERVLLAILGYEEEKAEQALRNAERSRLPEAKLRFLRGMHLVTTGRAALAVPELEAVRRLEPDNVAALGLLAWATGVAKGGAASERLLPALEQARPVSPTDKLFLGQALAGAGLAEVGIPLIEQAVEAEGSPMARNALATWRGHSAVANTNLALMREALDDIAAVSAWRPRAVRPLMSAWRLHSQAAELYRRTGDEQRAQAQMRLAEQTIGRLEAFHPTNVFALQTRLDHLLRTGQTEQVLDLATRSSRVLPGSQLELYAVHALASTGNYERALELVRRFRAGPGKDDPWMQLAHLLTAVEDTNAWAEAVALVAEVSGKAPSNLQDWLTTTRLNLLMGRSRQAQQIAQDFLRNQSRWLGLKTRAFEMRAVRLLAGEIPEEDWLEEAKGRGWPALVNAHGLVALQHLARGDRDSARSHLRHACDAALVPGRTVLVSTYLLKRLTEDTNWPPTIPPAVADPTP